MDAIDWAIESPATTSPQQLPVITTSQIISKLQPARPPPQECTPLAVEHPETPACPGNAAQPSAIPPIQPIIDRYMDPYIRDIVYQYCIKDRDDTIADLSYKAYELLGTDVSCMKPRAYMNDAVFLDNITLFICI